jgi:hypothetical protein
MIMPVTVTVTVTDQDSDWENIRAGPRLRFRAAEA